MTEGVPATEGVNTVEMIKTAATKGPHASTSGTVEYIDNRDANSSMRTSTSKADSSSTVRCLQQQGVRNIIKDSVAIT
jgi:hypothetical protein